MSIEQLFFYEIFTVTLVLGLVVGSFLNVCIHRIPLDQSIAYPPSACPHCAHSIAWYQNIPLLSFALLGGRCGACRAPISWRYPLVESANAVLWALAYWRFGPSVATAVLLPFLSALLVLFFTDWDHQILPDKITFPLALLGLILAPFNAQLDFVVQLFGEVTPLHRFFAALAGAFVGWFVFFAVAAIWKILLKKDALGGGDLKLMLGVGAFTGVGGVFLTIFGGSMLGTLIAAPFLMRGSWTMGRELPFGCFLVPAAIFAGLWGDTALRWYLALPQR